MAQRSVGCRGACLLLSGILGGCRLGPSVTSARLNADAARHATRPHRGPASERPYAAGELLLKLSAEIGARLDQALTEQRAATYTGIEWLDAMNARYGVERIEPLFASPMDVEAVRRRFPERAKRAPPDAQVHKLAHVYKLTMPEHTDMPRASAEYGAQPDVEYAHPNYLAGIQQGRMK